LFKRTRLQERTVMPGWLTMLGLLFQQRQLQGDSFEVLKIINGFYRVNKYSKTTL